MLPSQDGRTFLGLCTILKRFHTSASTAHILHQLARDSGLPDNLNPPFRAWKNLVPICGALLDIGDFETLLKQYNSLLPAENSNGLEHASCETVAAAVFAMDGLASKSSTAGRGVSVYAGRDGGFIAAVAQWLFGLSVKIFEPG